MEKESELIDTWIFEYLAHRCIQRYFEDGFDILYDKHLMKQDIDAFSSYINSTTNAHNDTRGFICFLFLHLLCMEDSLVKNGGQIDCDYIGEADFRESIARCIAFASKGTQNEDIRKLARHCLIQSHVLVFKYCKRNDTGWEEALKSFQDFMTLLPTDECKEMYDMCATTKRINPDEDLLISEYMDSLRQLVSALYSEYEEPDLIKFARSVDHEASDDNQSRRGHRSEVNKNVNIDEDDKNFDIDEDEDEESSGQTTTELEVLLKDRRPSRKSDLEEIRLEESQAVSKMRKKFLGFNQESHRQKVIELEKRMHKKPPSHQNFRLGPWMPEEERAFIEKTLEIGAGRWTEIKKALNTFRSSQQLKDKWRLIKNSHIEEIRKKMKSASRTKRH